MIKQSLMIIILAIVGVWVRIMIKFIVVFTAIGHCKIKNKCILLSPTPLKTFPPVKTALLVHSERLPPQYFAMVHHGHVCLRFAFALFAPLVNVGLVSVTNVD